MGRIHLSHTHTCKQFLPRPEKFLVWKSKVLHTVNEHNFLKALHHKETKITRMSIKLKKCKRSGLIMTGTSYQQFRDI